MAGWWTILAFPVFVYTGFFARDVLREGYLIFGRLDLLLALGVGAYLLSLPLLVRTRRHAFAGIALVAALALSLVIAESVARAKNPQPCIESYPWPPMTQTRAIDPAITGVTSPASFHVNRWGLRGPDVTVVDRDASILCVGGSTTECLYVTDEKSWPWRLGTLLSESKGRSIVVGNAGRSGHMARHHEYLVKHYPATTAFAWVVVMAGINDMGALLQGDRSERESRVPDDTLFRWSRPHEASYRRLALWRWMEGTLNIGTAVGAGQIIQDAAGGWVKERRLERKRKRENNLIDKVPAGVQEDLTAYRARLESLVTTCSEQGVKLLLVTQPTLYRDDLPQALEERLVQQTETGAYSARVLADLMKQYNGVMMEVGEETGTPVVDLARDLSAQESFFYDDCHFSEAGCEEVARRLAATFETVFDGGPTPLD